MNPVHDYWAYNREMKDRDVQPLRFSEWWALMKTKYNK